MTIELKIKNKHLAQEARIIRTEEKKLKAHTRANIEHHKKQGHNEPYDVYNDSANRSRMSLEQHRKWDVRNEQRATFLARAYLEGKAFNEVETNSDTKGYKFRIVQKRVLTMINKYGKNKIEMKDLDKWINPS